MNLYKIVKEVIAHYIEIMAKKHQELKDWTILVVSPPNNKSVELGLKNIKSIKPGERTEKLSTQIDWSKQYMIFSKGFHNPSDLICDLSNEELEKEDYNKYKSRKMRSPEKGLLCIYPIVGIDVSGKNTGNFPLFAYGIDFPESKKAEKLEYVIDEIMQKEFED